MTYTKKTNLEVYETTDYSQFKYYDSNRKITRNSSLENDILKTNKLKYHPITVNTEKKVIDGQHRLDICIRNKLPVYFIIDNESIETDIMSVQSAKKWKQSDFLKFYCTKGKIAYQIIDNAIETHRVCITSLIRVFCVNLGNQTARLFMTGDIQLKYEEDYIYEILKQYQEVIEISDWVAGKRRRYTRDFEASLLHVLITISESESGDFEHLIDRVKHNHEAIERCLLLNSTNSIKEVLLDEVYNKHLGKRKRVPLAA